MSNEMFAYLYIWFMLSGFALFIYSSLKVSKHKDDELYVIDVVVFILCLPATIVFTLYALIVKVCSIKIY